MKLVHPANTPSLSQPAALQFRGIAKSFFDVQVIKEVSFEIPAGATVGLVGENGAGKSTLMNILGGIFTPDKGEMLVSGEKYEPKSPRDAARNGIAFIHQELNLFPNLSIAENIFLTAFPVWKGFGFPIVRQQEIHLKTQELLRESGLSASPDTLVENLSAGERQLVEIAKAIGTHASLLILDEPTTSLSFRERDHLFTLLKKLKSRGISMIYISHDLGDVFQLCDQVIVLRDGQKVGDGPVQEWTVDRMISVMVGRPLSQAFPTRIGEPSPEIALELRNVSQPGVVRQISLELHRGEILGLGGLMGSGRSELARIIFGLDPFHCGEMLLDGKPFHPRPRTCVEKKIAFITEDRRDEGLCLEASIAENMALVSVPAHASGPVQWIDQATLLSRINAVRHDVQLSASARNEQAVKTLSGGNQQKVVIAKWLLNGPSIIILDEPTRGIDVGAKFEIYLLIHKLVQSGAAILIISSELEELLGLCDRILVMNRGEIKDELRRPEFDRERILRAAMQGVENE